VNVDILGPLRVRDSRGREIRLPAGRERSLLALLLIHRGEVVSTDRIVDALWGESPPGTAAKAVQGYVSHLRRVLEPLHEPGAADSLLLTRAPGYVLRVNGVVVDATRFEQLAAGGRRALEDGQPAEAAGFLEEALALWRGPALSDFAYDDFAQTEIRRLEELRLAATEDRIESLLQLGHHGDLVGQLEPLVVAHPLRERLRAQLMLALYRGGRQADALQVYRDGRRLLADELGLEPGPELQRLERAILEQDPALEAPAPALTHPPAPAGEPEGAPAPKRPRRRLIGAALVAVAALAAAVLFALTRDETPESVEVVPPAVVAVDPDTNRVVAAVPVGSKPVSVAAGEGAVWVGDVGDSTVTRVDPLTHAVKTIGIGGPAVDLATGFGSVWVATGGFGTVVRIDPDLAAVVDRMELGDPSDPAVPAVSSIAAGEQSVWVGAFSGLGRIAPRSDKLTQKVDLGRSSALQIAAGAGAVWATLLTNRAKRVEERSGQVTAQFYTGAFPYPIALDRAAVWIGGAEGQLWKIDPITASTLLTSRVSAAPVGLAVGHGAVWVAASDESLIRVDPATGDIEASIDVGGAAQDVTVGHGLVWVAVQAPPASG
jgi:DNA-binding SARP family transcriptional activator/streptogramin lyase